MQKLGVVVADISDFGVSSGVSSLKAGKAVTLTPASGIGAVTVANAGVTSILPGTGITVSPVSGLGDVTVNATPGFSGKFTDLNFANSDIASILTKNLSELSGTITDTQHGSRGAISKAHTLSDIATNYVSVSGILYFVVDTDFGIGVTTGAANTTVQLPSAATRIHPLIIKKIDTGNGLVAITPAANESIDNGGLNAILNLNTQNESAFLIPDGVSNWNNATGWKELPGTAPPSKLGPVNANTLNLDTKYLSNAGAGQYLFPPNGSMYLLNADEVQVTGTGTNATAKSFSLSANTFSRIMVESEIAVLGVANSAFDVVFQITFGGVAQGNLQELRVDSLGAGKSADLMGNLKFSKAQTAALTIAISISVITGTATWLVSSLRVYGVR